MNKEDQANLQEKRIEETCKMIMRQTDYTYDESRDKLIKENFNYLTVIQKYVTGDTAESSSDKTVTKSSDKTVNQHIYSELRNFMDTAAVGYEQRKRRAEKMEKFREKLAEEYERRQQEAGNRTETENKETINNDPEK